MKEKANWSKSKKERKKERKRRKKRSKKKIKDAIMEHCFSIDKLIDAFEKNFFQIKIIKERRK
jgi:hypothetical protein